MMMRFELVGEALELEWDEGEGMFLVTLGPKHGKRCTIGSHVERACAVLMFNWEAKAMQGKWQEET